MTDTLKTHGVMLAALLAIVVGYILLASQRLTLGPVSLVLGYCVLFPFYLWQTFRRRAARPESASGDDNRG
jgi:hypothetical protein